MKAVFVDGDVIRARTAAGTEPQQIRLAPSAGDGLKRLEGLGYNVVVVANRPGITAERIDALAAEERRVRRLLAQAGVTPSQFYYCPHTARDACACRKPAPGLLLMASREHGIDLTRSWMIGDVLDDVEAGRRAGCRTVLIDNGSETRWRDGPLRRPEFCVVDVATAARCIAANHISAASGTGG